MRHASQPTNAESCMTHVAVSERLHQQSPPSPKWPAPQLPLHYHMPTMLLKWAAMTAGGCLVDRQLLGSAAAGWRTYAWSFTCIVVASSVAVAWVEGGMRRRFAAAWAAQGGRSAQCTAAEARALQGGGLSKACSSAADAPDGAAPQAAGAAAGASSAAAAAAEVVSTAGSGGGSKAAAAIMAAPLPARAAVPRRSSLYSTTRAGRQVTLSVKVGGCTLRCCACVCPVSPACAAEMRARPTACLTLARHSWACTAACRCASKHRHPAS